MLMFECSPPFQWRLKWFRTGRIWRVMFAYFGVSYVPFGFVAYVHALTAVAAAVNAQKRRELGGATPPETTLLTALSQRWVPFEVELPPEGKVVDLWCRHREDGWERRYPDMMFNDGKWRMMLGNVMLDTLSPVTEPLYWRKPRWALQLVLKLVKYGFVQRGG